MSPKLPRRPTSLRPTSLRPTSLGPRPGRTSPRPTSPRRSPFRPTAPIGPIGPIGPAVPTGPSYAAGPGRIPRRLTRLLSPVSLRRHLSDRGSMSVELVVIAPALALLLLLIGAGGRWVESHGALDGAARDAARAASIGRTPGDADSLAAQAADSDLASSGWCDGGTVAVGVTGFPDTAVVAEGTSVTVTVSCHVNMSPFTLLGFAAATPVTATAVAPLDPFMCRGANCQ